MDSMRYLAEDNPKLVTIEKIGESYLKNNPGRTNGRYKIPEDGHDMYAVVVTDSTSSVSSQSKGKFFITSGLHAREYAPPELLARFIEKLVKEYGKDADVTTILQRTEIHAVLYGNPDGRWVAERYKELYWRKNLNPNGGCNDDESIGVDLNRNFGFKHGDRDGASDNPCDSDYHGGSDESEPETQAIVNYMKKLFPASQRKQNPQNDWDEPFDE